MTIEEILAGESKNVEFKENLPEKSIKYMKSVVAFANGAGGKKWMPLLMLCRIVVNRQLFQILHYGQLTVRLLL